jgi:hypothetical protein
VDGGVVERGLLRQGVRYARGLRLIVVALSSTMSLLPAAADDLQSHRQSRGA